MKLSDFLDHIVPSLNTRLPGWVLGSEQRDHVLGILGGLDLLKNEAPHCSDMAREMANWAWQHNPLDIELAKRCKTLGAGGGQAALATELIAEDDGGFGANFAQALAEDLDQAMHFLLTNITKPGLGLTLLAGAWKPLLQAGDPELSRTTLGTIDWAPVLEPLKSRLKAERAVQLLKPEHGLSNLRRMEGDDFKLWRDYWEAELLLRLGEKGEAVERFTALWRANPWHVNLTLKLHALTFEPAPAPKQLFKDTAILVYSWNKADLMAQTLDSLAASTLHGAKVYALNNGSTDHTAEVLLKAEEKFEPGQFTAITLPINIGAPPARNWLLSLPEVREHKWAAFLDDDVILPPDWLEKLLAATQFRDNLGAVGCRITAAEKPFGLQSADYNLIPGKPRETEPGTLGNRVMVFDNCSGGLDNGLFSYSRPCMSVSGCCHVINMEAIERAGNFDVRFNPSQFDDLERDMRSCLAGMGTYYVGTLAIKHVQHSSLAKAKSMQAMGHVLGNKYKLDTKYSDEELMRLGDETILRLNADLIEKYRDLAGYFETARQ